MACDGRWAQPNVPHPSGRLRFRERPRVAVFCPPRRCRTAIPAARAILPYLLPPPLSALPARRAVFSPWSRRDSAVKRSRASGKCPERVAGLSRTNRKKRARWVCRAGRAATAVHEATASLGKTEKRILPIRREGLGKSVSSPRFSGAKFRLRAENIRASIRPRD